MNFVIEGLGLLSYGTKQVALEILPRFGRRLEHDFTLILPRIPEYAAITGPNLSVLGIPRSRSLLRREVLLNRYVPKLCRDKRADALLCMGSFIPRRLPCPTAVFLQFPPVVYREPAVEGSLTLRDRLIVAYGRSLYRRMPRKVLVIVQIEAIKRRLVSLYGIDPERIVVIPSTMPTFLPGRHHSSPSRGPREPFLFVCFARYYPHKNIEILFDALRRLPRYTARPARCLINISAHQGPGARKFLRKTAQAGERSNITCIEPVGREELPGLYQSGDAYIFPTLMETFSMTYDEAMHFSLPILTSDRDFAKERCGDAAVYFDPLDADSVAKAMARVMEDEQLCRRLVENGQRILAKAPSWDDIAGRFVDVLEHVARGQLPPADKSGSAGKGDHQHIA
jgi:glycosyltransferase involved in cell wall biosynthesis